jgi:parallel beta-helix repeat protein
MFTNNEHQGSGSADNALFVSNVANVNISSNTFGTSTDSAIYLTDADNGTVCGNNIDSPGFNTPNSSAATAPAGIRLIGCKNLAVTGNSITTGSVGTYNGFGIISSNNGARTSRSVFTGNYIQTNFTGAAHRSQNRVLNTETTDSLSSNTFDNVSFKENRLLGTTNGVYYAVPLTYQAAAGTVLLDTLNLSFARVYVHVEQLSSAVSFEFEVVVTRLNFTGLYAIKTVNRDSTYGAGDGPHVLTTGNTVLFSISSAQLAITFAYASDPMLYSVIVVGARA